MGSPGRRRVAVALILIFAAALFGLGINWGLPSRAVDRYLFGDRPVWAGEKIHSLAPAEAAGIGADVDSTPILIRDRVLVLNENDVARAEIIRRYRLFSHQPDEMITFKSLAQIGRHRGDPRLYQYGGLWIYPVGALLKAASTIGLVELRGGAEGQAYYLDHPDAFGRFYVIARLYSVAWGLVAVWAVWWIVRRISGGIVLPALGALTFAAMPVVITLAHEAKPHLPGLALTLLAVIAAAKHVETGRTKWAMLAGGLCGAAFGMVLSALLAFAILPVMVLLRPQPIRERLLTLVQATVMGLVVYVVTNPFVLINVVADRAILRSNLANSAEMYNVSLTGIAHAVALVLDGASPVLTAAGVVGAVFLLLTEIMRRLRPPRELDCPGRGDVGWLLAAPAALVMIQFVLLAAEKPPEYARFGLVVAAFLLVAAFAALGRVRADRVRVALGAALLGFTLLAGVPYVVAFVRDSGGGQTSRLAAAERLRQLADAGATTLRVSAEPAPYVMPPVDLFRFRLLLPPPGETTEADVIVHPDHRRTAAPISWADTRFIIVSPFERLRQWERAPATAPLEGGANDAADAGDANASPVRPAAPPAVSSAP